MVGTLGGFTTHMMMHDEDKKKWVCKTCNKRFPFESLLKRHTPLHSDAKDHKCPSRTCGKTFKSHQSLKAHLELHSRKQFTFLHLGCTKIFGSAHYRRGPYEYAAWRPVSVQAGPGWVQFYNLGLHYSA